MTREYPDGKLNDDDEGELTILVCVEKGRVMVMFPKPVKWFALPPQQAVDLAKIIVSNAQAAGFNEPVTFTLGGRHEH